MRKSYVNRLLDAGQPEEALAELEAFQSMANGDKDVLFQMVSAQSLCGHTDKANALAAGLEEKYPEGKTYLWLAQIFYDGGHAEMSRHYYQRALECDFYPEALYAMARAEYKNDSYDKAREFLISAIDCTKSVGDGSVGALGVLQMVCSAMLTMGDESEGCRIYQGEVDLTGSPGQANSMHLSVCARSSEDAMQHVKWLYGAMYPGSEFSEGAIHLEETADDLSLNQTRVPGVHEVHLS